MSTDMKFWLNGIPLGEADVSGNDGGTMKFWLNGIPNAGVVPTAGGGGGTPLKTINDLVISFVKTECDLAIASLKTESGLSNV